MNRIQLKEAMQKKIGSFAYICKYIGYCKTYTWEVLNGYKKGTIEFFSHCIDTLGLRLNPEEKALQIMYLLNSVEGVE